MRRAWHIYSSVFHQLGVNFKSMMRLVVPNVILIAIIGALLSIITPNLSRALFLLFATIYSVFVVVIFCGVAVNVHRYFLLGERIKNWRPLQFHWDEVMQYLGISVFIFVFTMIPVNLISNFVLGYALAFKFVMPQMASWVLIALQFTILLPMLWVSMRLGICLPSIACGEELTFRKSWGATKPQSKLFWGLAVITVIIALVFRLIGNALATAAMTVPIWVFFIVIFVYVILSILYILSQFGVLTESYDKYFRQKRA